MDTGAKMVWLDVKRLLLSTPLWLCFAPDHLSLACLTKLYFNYFPGWEEGCLYSLCICVYGGLSASN